MSKRLALVVSQNAGSVRVDFLILAMAIGAARITQRRGLARQRH